MTSVSIVDECYPEGYRRASSWDYLPFLHMTPLVDLSFWVHVSGEPVVYYPCFVVDGVAGWHDGTSSVPVVSPTADPAAVAQAARAVVKRVEAILERPDVDIVKVLCTPSLPVDSFSRLTTVENFREYGYVNLGLDAPEIMRRVRKSYRSLINKGSLSLTRTSYSSATELPRAVLNFLLDSRGVSEGAAWGMLGRMQNAYSLVLVYREQDEIAGVMEVVSWDKFTAHGDLLYNIAAYNHDLDVPKHFCIIDAAMFFKQRGGYDRLFLMNASRVVRDHSDDNQKKLADIDFFKRGFCSDSFTREYCIFTLAQGYGAGTANGAQRAGPSEAQTRECVDDNLQGS